MACKKSLNIGALNYRSVRSLLENNLEATAIIPDKENIIPVHDNIRGNGYYKQGVIHD